MDAIFFLIFGYTLGSIPFGKLIAARAGIDIQKRGSGNIGFANVRRVLGWKAGLLTLALDIAKGALPTILAYQFAGEGWAFWAGICAIAGHVFPVWLRFRGGKGIATGLGVITALQPVVAMIGLVGYVVSSLIFRKSFVGSLLGTGLISLLGTLYDRGHWWQYVLLLGIAIWTLRNNIRGRVPDYDL